LAGRDMEKNGTWLGLNIKTGVIVILTNFDMETFIHVSEAKYGRG